MVIQEKHTLYRLYLIAAVLMLLGGGITYRLFFLQFVEGDKYRALAEERTIQNFTIAPARGNIYADDGSLLATSVSRYTIRFDAVTVKQHHLRVLDLCLLNGIY
jgi:cell division protein FtsI (penicillin-binding protein 3)